MNQIVDFIRDNWSYISFGLVILMELILLIVKRNKTSVYDNSIIAQLIPLVAAAEEIFGSGHGKEKLDYVVKTYNESHLQAQLPVKVIESFVESILATPEKKGSRNEKVK